MAVWPSIWMCAPRRTSSLTCMKRFSKIVSVTRADALGDAVERHELGLHVGREQPGTSLVRRLTALRRAGRDRARIAVAAGVDPHAGLAQLVDHRVEVSRRRLRRSVTSPPVAAAAHRKVPVSMRSGMIAVAWRRAGARRRWMRMPAGAARPRSARPSRSGSSARSTTSGSRAAFSRIGLAVGQRRGHHQVLGAGDRHHVGGDARALQARAAVAWM